MYRPIMLIVLDGWGYRTETANNAIAAAHKPFMDKLWQTYPHSLLKASGEAVGLPEGQMGNSEVGHMTIGIGRPAETDLTRINKAIASGDFDKNPVFQHLFNHVKTLHSTLHVQGLVSPGGVHSHQDHLCAFLRLAKKHQVERVAIHVFTDGRDTPPQSAAEYVRRLESLLDTLNADSTTAHFYIATISGRYYAMDRDHNWDRLAKTEQAMIDRKGQICDVKASEYLEIQYKNDERDEMIVPAVCQLPDMPDAAIKKNDGIFFFNFRPDRARMLTEKMIAFSENKNIMFATMTQYDANFKCPAAFPPFKVETTLGQEISKAGLKQARVAETEKFAHATYFLNGGHEQSYEDEHDILIPSRKDVKTHDLAPEMRATAIADKAIEEIATGTDFIFVNFANADMVGHTANVPAIIKAIEVVDTELERVITALQDHNGIALVTADHGNAEINIDPITGAKHTAHTTNPVPCFLTSHDFKLHDGALFDVAPTILKLFNLPIPQAMTGKPLI